MGDKKKILDGKSVPFRGGMDTRREKALIPLGGFSDIHNMRNRHPGMEQRKGMTYHHSTAYSTTLFVRYKQQTGSFSSGDSVVGYPSGSTATVASVYDLGNNVGLLGLSSITGTFNGTNEIIYVASYGSELLTNGNFTNWTGDDPDDWTVGNEDGSNYVTESAGGGEARFVSVGSSLLQIYQAPLTVGLFYLYSAEITAGYGQIKLLMGNDTFETMTSVDTYSGVGQCGNLAGTFVLWGGEIASDMTIDNVSCKKVTNAALVDGTAINSPHSLYQFSKGKRNEKHFFAQMRDGTLLEATDNPPTTTTGAFGSNVFSGSVNDNCASYSDIDDVMIYSNGIDQHKLYAGTYNPVLAFIRHDDATSISLFPTSYIDYTREVTDGDSSTVAVLDSLDVIANDEAIYIATDIPANRLTFTITVANGTASVGTLKYRKNDNTWADTSETDGTISSGATMAVSGSMTWTHPSDEIPITLFGISAYWYQWEVSVQLDAEVEVSDVTYGSGFMSLTNVWNGRKDYIIEAVFDDDADSTISTYSGDNVTIDAMTTSDVLYISSYDPLEGIYVDVGSAPNTVTTSTIAIVYYWNGSAWTDATETDYTSGLGQSGHIYWGRLSQGTQQRTKITGSSIYAYWYKIMIGTDTTSVMNVAIYGIPYYEIDDFGKSGVSATWKDRGCYSFNQYGNYVYVSEKYRPNVLNGDDFAILEAGDGRANRIVCMKRFHNELMVWQEEKGKDGGCLTIFEGYSPTTFGKHLISSEVGTFSQKSAIVVDSLKITAESTKDFEQYNYKKRAVRYAYFLSRSGICRSEGINVEIISDEVQNHFDPTNSDCIRRGYESEMWIAHDSAYNVLRIGLVTGSSATTCNTFLIYDLVDETFSYDSYGQNISCMTEVEAESGDIQVLQYGGGTDDGAIYRLNTETNDVDIGTTTTAINAYAIVEISYYGLILQIRELFLRMKSQSDGNCTVTIYRRGIADSNTLTLSMTAEITNDESRRHDIGLKSLKGDQLSLKFQNNTASQELYLLDFGLNMSSLDKR